MNLDPTTVEASIAFFVPILVALLKQTGFPAGYNAVIAVVVYVVFGVLSVVAQGQTFDLNNIVPSVTIFVTVGTVAYTAFWRNVGEPALTAKTSAVK
jgi:Na+/pantothenate symporter